MLLTASYLPELVHTQCERDIYLFCRAIELIYLMCELESSVVFVEHAERVFNEASQDFKELKLRISDQLLFQSYIEVCRLDLFALDSPSESNAPVTPLLVVQESPVEEIDHLSIAWDVPSFKLDYSRHLPDEGAAPGCAERMLSPGVMRLPAVLRSLQHCNSGVCTCSVTK